MNIHVLLTCSGTCSGRHILRKFYENFTFLHIRNQNDIKNRDGVMPEPKYLERFFRNMLLGGKIAI